LLKPALNFGQHDLQYLLKVTFETKGALARPQ